jgi:hypothetical protein
MDDNDSFYNLELRKRRILRAGCFDWRKSAVQIVETYRKLT